MTNTSRLAIDVGGTFTDVVELVPETGELRFDKVPTTPQSPTTGVMNAFGAATVGVGEIATFTHGTTLGLNALLTRTGARTAVIGTKGFRDVYLLGRTDRRSNYDITYRKPTPLLERYDTFEVLERSLFDGSVHRPLDIEDARRVAAVVAERGYQSVAVAFLHSYANPAHELRMREVLAEIAPDVAVTLSHELSREYREYERTSTAVLDAYVKPIVRRYLRALEDDLAAGGFSGRFLMTRSGGGSMTAATAREQPVSLILSGPAGGVIGAAALSELIAEPNLITIDMGGTSLDASLILDHEAVLYQGAEFEQLPINTPSLYIHTIGAGGGSIVHLDGAGALQVGPQSAGAAPGPASYGRGGTIPTFTDAALAIGYLGTETPLGGKLRLDPELAAKALEPVAAELRMAVPELARGV
ncbi:hydantoinase/oxoprolinase family protein, partial [Actinomadura sp. HBU206391]|uniref:hydantoinase/oxoprolinase family protein n=1 Tax=Actinomadura sp. HBU206391 TaxID=2731692 RepID=UPI00164F92E3